MSEEMLKLVLEGQREIREDMKAAKAKQDAILDAVYEVKGIASSNATRIDVHDRLDDQRFADTNKRVDLTHDRITNLKTDIKNDSKPDKRLLGIIATLAAAVAAGFTKLLSAVLDG